MRFDRSPAHLLVAGLLLALAWGGSAAAADAPDSSSASGASDPALKELLAGFDRVQGTIRTLSAEFVETTTSPLLKEPIQAKGRFYLTKPSSVLWEYTEPEVMRFAIANNQYVGYFPQRKRAEKSDVHRWSERIFRIFGLGQTSTELGNFYVIRTEKPAPEDSGTLLLVLEPKKRRVRKHIELVRFWVNATTYLPVKIELSGKDGYVRVIQFHDVQVNPDLAAGLYQIEIPPDVKVTSGTTGLETVRPQGSSRLR